MAFQPIAEFHIAEPGFTPVKTIRRYQSRRFVIGVRTSDTLFKVFQVIFSKSDGSLLVNIPYSSIPHGILSEGRVPRGNLPSQVHLDERGKVTSQLVKYAHHPDGRAHFSQDGKVRTEIARQSFPLALAKGHLFTLHAQGLSQFAKDHSTENSPASASRTLLTFAFNEYSPLGLKFVGWWYHVKTLGERTDPGPIGPRVTTQKPDGSRSQSFIIGPLLGEPMHEHLLVLSCEAHPILDSSEPHLLTLIGGFGPAPAVDPLTESYFLCASYPTSNYAALAHTIGSIDFHAPDSSPDAA